MIFRTSTFLTMLIAAGTGLYLYQTKHRSQLLDREIVHVIRQTEQIRERMAVLRGEWAVLDEPDRLAELARQHAPALRNPAATQFVAMADLPSRLPAPLAPGSMPQVPGEDLDEGPTAAQIAMAGIGQTAAKPAPPPAAPKPAAVAQQAPAPTPPAAAAPPAPKPVQVASRPTPKPKPPMEERVAEERPAPPRFASVVPVAALPNGTSIGESVARVSRGLAPIAVVPAQPRAAAYVPVPAYAAARPAPSYAAPSYPSYVAAQPVASLLGGTGQAALPPPVPYGSR